MEIVLSIFRERSRFGWREKVDCISVCVGSIATDGGSTPKVLPSRGWRTLATLVEVYGVDLFSRSGIV